MRLESKTFSMRRAIHENVPVAAKPKAFPGHLVKRGPTCMN
jgi:hypothetical protein